ncbi:hypothetical protein SAMN02949497_3934 [Methylomagnum ishizawai]|uniref:Uncharacterized protein n=1 Tax=Methylomagnum ishizawai TaxID=1760988 RepID=A0A1Y6D8H6_9GAMM|nr:hypothetical protein [Methylomagnum ishizawai]SMF96534.1 hypothetical protein SAMN02949497_3934 [Methylomagnum ishizawai]
MKPNPINAIHVPENLLIQFAKITFGKTTPTYVDFIAVSLGRAKSLSRLLADAGEAAKASGYTQLQPDHIQEAASVIAEEIEKAETLIDALFDSVREQGGGHG